MPRNLLLFLLLAGASATAQAQRIATPPAPPLAPALAPSPAPVPDLVLQRLPASQVSARQMVTLDTTPVKLRVDPRQPIPGPAPTRPALELKPKPRQ